MMRGALPGVGFLLLTINVWTVATRLGDARQCREMGHTATTEWAMPHPAGPMLLVDCAVPVPIPTPAPCEVC